MSSSGVQRVRVDDVDTWREAKSSVELREFVLTDAALLEAWIGGPEELLTWAGPAFAWPLDVKQIASYAAESPVRRRIWTALETRSGVAVGHASLRLEPGSSTGRLGRVLVASGARGQGIGGAMLEEVLASAFGALDLDRVELGVYSHNTAAVRLYERLGFGCDSVLDDVERVNGRAWSAMQMSITRPKASIRTVPTPGSVPALPVAGSPLVKARQHLAR